MFKIRSISVLLLSLCMIYSFKSSIISNKDLAGIWVFSKQTASYYEYTKSRSFKKDEPGFEFKTNGKFIIRQNSSWCGTPPIQFENYKGNWKFTSDSTIHIIHKYWGGTREQELLIIGLNETTLRLKITSTNNH